MFVRKFLPARVTGAVLLAGATRQLAQAGIPDPGRDARRLLAHVLGVAPGRLSLCLQDPVTPEDEAAFSDLIARRALHAPVSHLSSCKST